jgi:hypothetical protein
LFAPNALLNLEREIASHKAATITAVRGQPIERSQVSVPPQAEVNLGQNSIYAYYENRLDLLKITPNFNHR